VQKTSINSGGHTEIEYITFYLYHDKMYIISYGHSVPDTYTYLHYLYSYSEVILHCHRSLQLF